MAAVATRGEADMPKYYARFGPTSGLVEASNHMHAIHVYYFPSGITSIGEALRAESEEDCGPALWRLTIRGRELEERYCLADGRFLPVVRVNPPAQIPPRCTQRRRGNLRCVESTAPGSRVPTDQRRTESSRIKDDRAWTPFYADSGPARGLLPFLGADRPIGVLKALDDVSTIGMAICIGQTLAGGALWKLCVDDTWLPGRWIVVNRRFRGAKRELAPRSSSGG
jgi:hypothetical protein